MKMAATKALAALAREPVPSEVCECYDVKKIEFGPEYIIPKPFDPRVLLWEATAVAQAAVETGVAKQPYASLESYRGALQKRLQAMRGSTGPVGSIAPLRKVL
jgi:malate dehydrogenase (oxaloacetate-decarboxylating)(NADP+)